MKQQGLIYRSISWGGQRCIAIMEFFLKKYSGAVLEDPPWTTQLSLHTDKIRAEFLDLYDENLRDFRLLSSEQERIVAGNFWKVFILRAYGRNLPLNQSRSPVTAKLCSAIPDITSVMFSILEPGAHIKPHRGPYAGVLRCHIPLIVPPGDCGIRVGGERHRWQVGKVLVFDDTLEHEAWNHTADRRVVLFIDFLRPLPQPLALLNRMMIRLIGWSPFIGRMLRRSL